MQKFLDRDGTCYFVLIFEYFKHFIFCRGFLSIEIDRNGFFIRNKRVNVGESKESREESEGCVKIDKHSMCIRQMLGTSTCSM